MSCPAVAAAAAGELEAASKQEQQLPQLQQNAELIDEEEEVDLASAIPWSRLLSWRSIVVYGLLFGMAAYIGKQQYDKYRDIVAEQTIAEKRKIIHERMRPAPGGKFRLIGNI